ncbi:unnamed protein product, partial [marine sediment metagenome]
MVEKKDKNWTKREYHKEQKRLEKRINSLEGKGKKDSDNDKLIDKEIKEVEKELEDVESKGAEKHEARLGRPSLDVGISKEDEEKIEESSEEKL